MPVRPGWPPWFWGLLTLYAAMFLWYSQTWAFAWDESYHLLTAQLILAGKKPYLDFCFPQAPFNAYWNAGWMKLLGESWRMIHAVQALLTIGAVLLMADFAAGRFPVPEWRMAAAVTVALATGLNAMVFLYGPLAQPYGICLFTLVLAFRLAVLAAGRASALPSAAAGLSAGIAASSSLLTAAAAPLLLAWILVHNRKAGRWSKFLAFSAAAVLPFAPAFWLFWLGPRETWFNLVQYHAGFRRLYWPETTSHDLEVLTSWINSGPALILGLLAAIGVLYVMRGSQWPGPLKAEFYLCAWLTLGIGAELSLAHPTFAQYFLLIVPFVAVLAVPGLYVVRSRPLWPVLLISALFVIGLGRTLYDHREDATWIKYERLAAKIDEVTPRNAPIFANEPVYFLARRTPPSGYELDYTHRIDLPPVERARLHVLTEAEVQQQVQSGMFATAYTCEGYDSADYGLEKLYNRQAKQSDCTIYWDPKPPRSNNRSLTEPRP
uniref:Glycosyltransferase RgtA/B/C/D-like domain-containing protein n=1 Tax=Solibacter usitatus (strain Ellin6076) TaxID=234267 RepID=Q01UQ0_SOLUE